MSICNNVDHFAKGYVNNVSTFAQPIRQCLTDSLLHKWKHSQFGWMLAGHACFGEKAKVLPCGHSYCSICVDDLVKEYSLTCPKCRARYAVSDASQFPFAYDLEEVLSKMRMIPTVTTTAKTRPKSGRGISRKLNSLREEQENTILNSTSDCEETLSQLHGYNNDLGEWVADHEELINKLLYMINLHKKAQQLLEKEQDRVMELHQAGKQQQQVLRMAEDSLVAARTAKEVVTAIDRADRYHLAAEEWIQKCQSLFPDTDTVHMSIKVRAATREALELMMQEANREQTGSSIVPKEIKMLSCTSQARQPRKSSQR
nr:uncharacterized protein LOC113818581 [Penaeus vannamei]